MMSKTQPSYLRRIRNSSIVLTIALLCAHPYIPEKNLLIYPHPNTVTDLYSDAAIGGKSRTHWINKDMHHYQCIIDNTQLHPYCGAAIKLFRPTVTGYPRYNYTDLRSLDLTEYNGLRIDINFTGEAGRLRLAIRNVNKDHIKDIQKTIAFEDEKFIYTFIKKEETLSPVLLDLRNFALGEWWIKQHYTKRSDLLINFDRVIELAFDIDGENINGVYDFQIKKIEAVGEWLSSEELYRIVIIYWLALFALIGSIKVLNVIATTKNTKQALSQLETDFQKLKVVSEKDALTQVYSRRGLERVANQFFESHYTTGSYVALLDIDYFKHINDTYGHDTGDAALKAFALCLMNNMRDDDILGRWGGEEFIIFCKLHSKQAALEFTEKLRQIISDLHITAGESDVAIPITVSIGITPIKPEDSLESAFKRVDTALYVAKDNGRNQCQYAE